MTINKNDENKVINSNSNFKKEFPKWEKQKIIDSIERGNLIFQINNQKKERNKIFNSMGLTKGLFKIYCESPTSAWILYKNNQLKIKDKLIETYIKIEELIDSSNYDDINQDDNSMTLDGFIFEQYIWQDLYEKFGDEEILNLSLNEETISLVNFNKITEKIIIEPKFIWKNWKCKPDFLSKNDDSSYDLYEIKANKLKWNSSKSIIKSENLIKKHKTDLFYQFNFLQNFGLKIRNVFLVCLSPKKDYLNSADYFYKFEKVDIKQFLKTQEWFYDDINFLDMLIKIENDVNTKTMPTIPIFSTSKSSIILTRLQLFSNKYILGLNKNFENITYNILDYYTIGDFKKYFYSKLDSYDILENNFKLLALPFYTKDNSLNKKQIVRFETINLIKENSLFKEELIIFKEEKVLEKLKKEYFQKKPIYMFDFETFKCSLPLSNYFQAYEQIPFQYSIHIITDAKNFFFEPKPNLNEGKNLYHFAFLSKKTIDDQDFILDFIKQFTIDMFQKGNGIYVAYYKTFEKTIIKQLINWLEVLEIEKTLKKVLNKKLNFILDNLFDLYEFWKEGLVVNVKQKCSASIKKVLPSIYPELYYKEMFKNGVSNGFEASNIFYQYFVKAISAEEYLNKSYYDLLVYCNMDTYAMVGLFFYLVNRII